MNTFLTIPLFLGFGNLKGMEWVILIVAFLLLFGATRIPKLMRNVGKGVRGFKQGLNDMKEEINKPVDEDDNKPEEKEKGTSADNPADK